MENPADPADTAGARGGAGPLDRHTGAHGAALSHGLTGPGRAAPTPRAAARAGNGNPVALLSRAERRVVGLVAEGFTNRAVAARLFVTPSTVEQHLTRVYRKLDVGSRAGLTALWRAADGAGDGSGCRAPAAGG
ncbi:helix-turn-helix transcriptional regulator [Streptomyces sp. NPDC102402]|uniref:helix-turn-helix domain-containing protein n=1 Tax=Streptomyces sp. NPDC102402 TaxID=3366169 RepID=UPI00380BDFAF